VKVPVTQGGLYLPLLMALIAQLPQRVFYSDSR
jgi:hypothetical protein